MGCTFRVLGKEQDAYWSYRMTAFHEFVFFLSTAQEELARFFGTENHIRAVASYVGPDLIGPGTYHVQDGTLVRDESVQLGNHIAVDETGV